MSRRARWLLVAALAVLCADAAPAAPSGLPLVAVVSRGTTQPFWQNVLRGAQMAAKDYAVAVTFAGPEDGSADAQAAILGDLLAKHPAALCVDAVDSRSIASLLQQARGANVAIIGFGEGGDSSLAIGTASTDNRPAAALAANKLASLVGPEARVGIILSDRTSRAGLERQEGFLDEMQRRHPGVQVVGPQYSAADPATAADEARAMIRSTPDLAGLFAGDEGTAAGVLGALQDLGLSGKVVVVGFDSGQAQVDAIRAGAEAGAVTQDAIRIGYKAVEAAADALRGRRVPRHIDTGFHWYDRTNIDDPAIAILLHP